MKKALVRVLIVSLGLFTAVMLAEIKPVQAANQVTITVTQGAVETPARGQPTTVYDLTPVVQNTTDLATLQATLQGLSEQQAKTYVIQHHLKAVTRFTMLDKQAIFTATPGRTYLLIQQLPIMRRGGDWVAPIVFTAGSASMTLEEKAVSARAAPYLYKYGQNSVTGRTAPLAGAVFALRRWRAGGWQYLTQQSTWLATRQPLLTAAVGRFTSDHTGLVLADVALAPGEYQFTELAAPNGYTITEAAKAIRVQVVESGMVSVRGAPLKPLLAGHASSSEAKRSALRVYNPTTTIPYHPDGGTTPPQSHLWLPKTGEDTLNLLLAGLITMIIAGFLWHRTINQEELKSKGD
ncbi:SpaA isopeptide-forming pilin-related protein [Lacticaseibacillus salsurivasis]|uniref:SpaA isopeptide-forming pilin-related protein n=1 Tax=Lacticaseibacillus salsurivasis TaxID=3081441 RepID=UPI0030C68E67